MRIVDITIPLHTDTVVYPGDPRFRSRAIASVTAGDPDSYSVHELTMGTHTGTHVDAPAHFVPGGRDVSELDLNALCGPCRVVDFRGGPRAIDARAFGERSLEGVERLLIKTTDSSLDEGWYDEQHAHLTEDGARYLREQTGVRLVGIDCLSIEAATAVGFPVHHLLLEGAAPVVVVESLNLSLVEPGDYELYCLPLSLRGLDASPARAILIADE